MKTSGSLALSVCLGAIAALTPVAASADPAGDKLCAAMDAAMNRAKTHKFDYEIVNQEPGKSERTMAMSVMLKGE